MNNVFKQISVRQIDMPETAPNTETIAAIIAGVSALLATGKIALRIPRTNSIWKQAGRQRL